MVEKHDKVEKKGVGIRVTGRQREEVGWEKVLLPLGWKAPEQVVRRLAGE